MKPSDELHAEPVEIVDVDQLPETGDPALQALLTERSVVLVDHPGDELLHFAPVLHFYNPATQWWILRLPDQPVAVGSAGVARFLDYARFRRVAGYTVLRNLRDEDTTALLGQHLDWWEPTAVFAQQPVLPLLRGRRGHLVRSWQPHVRGLAQAPLVLQLEDSDYRLLEEQLKEFYGVTAGLRSVHVYTQEQR